MASNLASMPFMQSLIFFFAIVASLMNSNSIILYLAFLRNHELRKVKKTKSHKLSGFLYPPHLSLNLLTLSALTLLSSIMYITFSYGRYDCTVTFFFPILSAISVASKPCARSSIIERYSAVS